MKNATKEAPNMSEVLLSEEDLADTYVDKYDQPAKQDQTDYSYSPLFDVLRDAFNQAAIGKGRDRHADDKPFTAQPIMEIARMLDGIDGHAFQMMKKAQEAARMVRRGQREAAQQELFGIINYAAAAVLLIRER